MSLEICLRLSYCQWIIGQNLSCLPWFSMGLSKLINHLLVKFRDLWFGLSSCPVCQRTIVYYLLFQDGRWPSISISMSSFTEYLLSLYLAYLWFIYETFTLFVPFNAFIETSALRFILGRSSSLNFNPNKFSLIKLLFFFLSKVPLRSRSRHCIPSVIKSSLKPWRHMTFTGNRQLGHLLISVLYMLGFNGGRIFLV
jgi:hypothetical protein